MLRALSPFCVVLPPYCLLANVPFIFFHNENESLPWSRDFYPLLISIGEDCARALLIWSWGWVAWVLLGICVDHLDACHTH